MKKIFAAFFVLAITSWSIASAKIIETPHFHHIQEHLQPNTLVLLDIDDTLLILKQTLGTDAWFLSQMKKNLNAGMSHQEALQLALNKWEGIRHFSEVEIVEAGTDKVINDMQENNVMVMGLTTQGLTLSNCTISQLNKLDIDLSKTPPSSEDFYFVQQGLGVLYHQGILFTGGTNKGHALFRLLDHLKFHPDRIVFINDKLAHLKDIETTAEKRDVEFIGLRYGYTDKKVATYDMNIAEIQWNASSFGHIISDEEAAILAP